ncbi:hypothetical protein KR222_002170 [Zaprionus bogoriensis]|nr:hypothetical protein KR222_002170 [Zaprionus bogoriensis]
MKAIGQCLKYYPGPSKSGKHLVTQYLISLLDSSDMDVVHQSGCCWLLLQQVRDSGSNSAGSNDKTQWHDFQNALVGSLNSLLSDAYPNYDSIHTEDTGNKFKCFLLTLEGDPVVRAAQVSQRFCNLIDYLKIALSLPYPAPKLIEPKKILNFIQRGLSLNIDDACYGHFLPLMHTKSLELLEVLIDVCNTHLRMHFRVISDLLLETFKNTKRLLPDGSNIEFNTLRSKLYKVMTLWISTFGEGIGKGFIVENLVKNIFEDFIFNTILEVGVQILQARKMLQNPYKDWHCRLELYRTLFSFISTRNLPFNPPIEIILYLLDECYQNDQCFEIRTCCRTMIDSFEKTIHPQKESLIFERVPQNVSTAQLVKESEPIDVDDNFDIIKKQNNESTQNYIDESPLKSPSIEAPKRPIKESECESNFFEALKKTKTEKSKKTPISIQNVNQITINKPSIKDNAEKHEKRFDEVNTSSKECRDSDTVSGKKLQKNDDDDYIAELEAAFVDELK